MSKFEYTDEMVERMNSAAEGGVTEELVQELVEEFGFPRRSVTAKLRKLGHDVPKQQNAPVFSAEETAELKSFLEANEGVYTAEEIAGQFADGKFNQRQINGKALSLEMTGYIKPAEKKETPKTYTPEQEAQISELVEKGSFIEEIADALGKSVQSIRGKLLSMGLKAPQRDKKTARSDAYEGIEDMAANMTVDELAEHFGKTARGVKTVLTRRGIAAKDHEPKAKE